MAYVKLGTTVSYFGRKPILSSEVYACLDDDKEIITKLLFILKIEGKKLYRLTFLSLNLWLWRWSRLGLSCNDLVPKSIPGLWLAELYV